MTKHIATFAIALLFPLLAQLQPPVQNSQPNAQFNTPSSTHSIAAPKFTLKTALNAAEPSAFEQQSGATKKDMAELKKSVQDLQELASLLQNMQTQIEQNQEGLNSIYESNAQKLQSSTLRLDTAEQDIKNIKSDLQTLRELIAEQQKNMEELGAKLNELQNLSIQTQDLILKELQGISEQNKPKPKPAASPTTFDPNKKAELFAQAKDFLNAKKFKNAKDILLWLKDQNYKKAEVTYYLGETAYLQKDFTLAIKYYKQSVALSDKGAYMPQLMLHTALSFKGIKDMANYNAFLQALADNYPNSPQGREAKDLLKKEANDRKQ